MQRRPSHLTEETSPYLLSHAQNPVDWYPWGTAALDRARAEDKPIFLSIGYSACHWCHVMERESFSDPAIAALLNQDFISIKVDREERPDLDEIYMTATVALAGGGGWPMTVFLAPTGEPFFAGTYFPPQDTDGRPGLTTLLKKIAEMWKKERETLLSQGKELTSHIHKSHQLPDPGGISGDSIRAACRAFEKDFDEVYGGFSAAPKFPAPLGLSLLLRAHHRTGQANLLKMVTLTLDGMMTGGLYDQLGGGFCRYSVDRMWMVPHFEKMLTDNALLAEVYIEAFQATGHAPYRRVARETLDYVLREMQSPGGGFFTASDADSEGQEGKYFVFEPSEVRKLLGEPRATYLCAYYGITEKGNFGPKSVLSARRSLSEVARELGVREDVFLGHLEEGRAALLAAREERVAPAIDDKLLTAHNGLLIRALAHGARAFSDERYARAAMRAADLLLAPTEGEVGVVRPDGGLFRTLRAGRAHTAAFLEDYVFLADGLLALYEAGCGSQYLGRAGALVERALADFSDPKGGALYFTAEGGESLVSRPRSGNDSAIPSANGALCLLLAKLSAHTGKTAYRERAIEIARSFSAPVRRAPRAHCALLCAIDFLLESPLEIVTSGAPEDPRAQALRKRLGSRFLPHRVEAHLFQAEEGPQLSPLTSDRGNETEPTAYVCHHFVCERPVHTPEELDELLEKTIASRAQVRVRELGGPLLKGRATKKATAGYAKKHGQLTGAYSLFEGLTVSRLGLGTHRIGLDIPEHAKSVRAALLGGMNLVDTSPTFAFGDSERVIAEVLATLNKEGLVEREQVVLISKVGVALGAFAERLEARRKSGDPPPFTCPLTPSDDKNSEKSESLDGGAFCLEPDFLREQLGASRERLGVEHIDVCLIQSPEHLLASGADRATFEEAVKGAFIALEAAVKDGFISAYGVLTNTAARPKEEKLTVSLADLRAWADQACGTKNHFKVLEVPLNLVEVLAHEKGPKPDLLSQAKDAHLFVLATRPLSPFVGGALLRLIDPPKSESPDPEAQLKSARYRVASLEAEFETTFAAALRVAKKLSPGPLLPLSSGLGKVLEQAETREQFRLAESTLVTPRVRKLLGQLDRAFGGPGDARWRKFRDQYVRAVGTYLGAIDQVASQKNAQLLAQLQSDIKESPRLSPFSGRGPEGEPWAERALRLLLSTPDLGGVLVGLRGEDQVSQALRSLKAASEGDSLPKERKG